MHLKQKSIDEVSRVPGIGKNIYKRKLTRKNLGTGLGLELSSTDHLDL